MTAPTRNTPDGATGGPPRDGARPLRHCLPLGRWGGVPVYAHWSVFLTVVLVGELLAASAFPAAEPGRSAFAYWLTGTLTAAAFWGTVLAHELAHAVVARHYGLPVRRVTLWALGGLTELDGEPATARADALIALAGPLTSLGLGGVGALVAWSTGGHGLVGAALAWLAGINVLLGLFNLLPGAPLDGGRLLQAVLWGHYRDRARARRTAAAAGRALGFALIALGFLELLAGAAGGIWLALVGWFVMSGAAADVAGARLDRLRGLDAAALMTPARAVLPDWWTVTQVLDELTPDQLAQTVFPLVDFGGTVSGAVTLNDLERVPAAQRGDVRVREVVHRARPLVVGEDATPADLVRALQRPGGVAVVIGADGHPVGVITVVELVRAARLAELRGPDAPGGPGGASAGG